jgi:DNA repair protein RecN (Recombination protein N)
MLDELHVTNLALIGEATLEPARGITVLTGETGAGKSALLSAIKLLIGERASADAVRDGTDGLSVEGVFFYEDGRDTAEFPDGHLAVRRVSAEGRSRCALDGSLATVSQLAESFGATVDLCGQHEHQRLLSPASHLPLLDSWAGEQVGPARASYDKAYAAYGQASLRLKKVLDARNAEAQRVEDARFALSRIEEVAPEEGEYESLEASLPRLQNAESLANAANAGYDALFGDGGAIDSINTAVSSLQGVSGFDPALDKIAKSLQDTVYPLEDAASDLRRYRDNVEFDPEALEAAQNRMAELSGLLRAFGPRMQDVLARRDEAAALVAMVDDSDRLERDARSKLEAAERDLVSAAEALSKARAKSAPEFAREVSAQMDRLHMGGAKLLVDVQRKPRQQWGASGADQVAFLYQPGPGLTPRSFAKIASGGEVSRVMLAIKVALGSHDDVETLIFDEIDAGVGGETARSVADVLADLARTHQVIVVSHLAQIAVRAQRHYVVSKSLSPVDGKPETRLELVSGEDRVNEIARMLSGDVEKASVEHARSMLEEAATVAEAASASAGSESPRNASCRAPEEA